MAKYKTISMNEAQEIFETKGNYIILDVRTPEEFKEGHIPEAVNVPNEGIFAVRPKELPDQNQIIYSYCRSGGRSSMACEKLAAMGYTNVTNCGGIIDWTGSVEK